MFMYSLWSVLISRKKESLGVDESGLLSFITFTWLTKYMFRAYKKGITLDDLPVGSPLDTCDYNAQRWLILYNIKQLAISEIVFQFYRVMVNSVNTTSRSFCLNCGDHLQWRGVYLVFCHSLNFWVTEDQTKTSTEDDLHS